MPDAPPARRWPLLASRCMLLCLLPLALLFGCGSYRSTPPTRGPITTSERMAPHMMDIALSSSTNCADIGQVITFTLHLENNYSKPVSIEGTPPIDIVINPATENTTMPIAPIRWSESPTYPAQIPTQIGPGEIHSYQWQWHADAAYGRYGGYGNGVIAQIKAIVEVNTMPYLYDDTLYVGVKSINTIHHNSWDCSVLPTAVPTPTVSVSDLSR